MSLKSFGAPVYHCANFPLHVYHFIHISLVVNSFRGLTCGSTLIIWPFCPSNPIHTCPYPRNLRFYHHQKWVSLKCHQTFGFRYNAIMKVCLPATMSFPFFSIHFIISLLVIPIFDDDKIAKWCDKCSGDTHFCYNGFPFWNKKWCDKCWKGISAFWHRIIMALWRNPKI